MNAHFSFSYFSSCHLCLLGFLALFSICLTDQNPDHVLCIEGERQALLRFKNDLTDETNRLNSWVDEERDCCRWVGIVCDNSTGHVHRIHLPGPDDHCNFEDYGTPKEYEEASKQRLKGDINPSLLDLKQLKHLDLSCNDFGGIQVPKFIGSLENLKYLNLSSSNFGGTIPPQLGNLSELHILALGSFHNRFVPIKTIMWNMQWLSGLRWLHHLDMSGVNLSKATDWHQVINTLSSLVELHLSNCELSHIQPHVPSLNLTSLSFLDLSFNDFNSPMPSWIFKLTNLVSLDLSGCNIHGIISSSNYSFRNLTSLKFLYIYGYDFMNSPLVFEELSSSKLISLYISSCSVSSLLLNSLRNLTSLRSLDLSYNQLTKKVPKSLGNLCNLREIDLSGNHFGQISLTNLLESFFDCEPPRLESLSISNSELSSPIPSVIGRLSLLKKLYMSDNRIEGSLPDSLGQLSKLNTLDFSYNSMTGVVSEAHFAKLVNLNYLDGTGNNLTLRLQVAIWIPPFKLQFLRLNSWHLGPQFPLWLQFQRNLSHLDISNTHISSQIPESFFRSFPNLSYLDMSDNEIQGMLRLSGIPSTIEVLVLNSNEFSGSLHHLLCSDGVKQTRDLNLGNNHLSGVIPECWEKWPNLVLLNLENNNLSGEIPRTLSSMSSLQFLSIYGNIISGSLPSSLMTLSNLKILQLGRNKLVGNIPTSIGTKLTFLRILNLRSNNFNGNIPQELCYLSHIQILDLSRNNLSGNIPRCFNNFSVLSGKETNSDAQFSFYVGFASFVAIVGDSFVTKGREETYSSILPLVMLLDLSSNNLVGDIPSELTSLLKLKSLNLSRNQLSGSIPEKIGDMKELISLDLSVNRLSGDLPMSLSRLNFLSSFNVSYNNLIGRIPTSTQIQSFNESSFFGNKLCGAPVTNSCVLVEVPTHNKQEKRGDNGIDMGLIITVVVGFLTGFWIIVAPLMFSNSWRIVYFRYLSKLIKIRGL
ncbi:putative non-specific serine/threonine protein kinase [Helianthus annuus]|nr:putative non-specific serine/threonine protein kinase [Helianthus annuus]